MCSSAAKAGTYLLWTARVNSCPDTLRVCSDFFAAANSGPDTRVLPASALAVPFANCYLLIAASQRRRGRIGIADLTGRLCGRSRRIQVGRVDKVEELAHVRLSSVSLGQAGEVEALLHELENRGEVHGRVGDEGWLGKRRDDDQRQAKAGASEIAGRIAGPEVHRCNAIRAGHVLRGSVGCIHARSYGLSGGAGSQCLNGLAVDHGTYVVKQPAAFVKSFDEHGVLPGSAVNQCLEETGHELRSCPNLRVFAGMFVATGDKCRLDIGELRQRAVLEVGKVLGDWHDAALLVRAGVLEVAQRGEHFAVGAHVNRVNLPGDAGVVEELEDGCGAQMALGFRKRVDETL